MSGIWLDFTLYSWGNTHTRSRIIIIIIISVQRPFSVLAGRFLHMIPFHITHTPKPFSMQTKFRPSSHIHPTSSYPCIYLLLVQPWNFYILKPNHNYLFAPCDQHSASSDHIYNAFNAKPTVKLCTSRKYCSRWGTFKLPYCGSTGDDIVILSQM